MDFKRIQPEKEIKRLPLKRDFLRNVNDRQEFYADDRGEISSESEVIQCARRDRKKEKWKQGRGRLDWKHGRKKGFNKKNLTFEEDTDIIVPRPIVSDKMREKNFDETNYLAPGAMLLPLYYSELPCDVDLRECIRTFCLESIDFEQIIEQKGMEILEKYPEIRARVTETGNCGALANFLYEEEENPSEGNFDEFINELGQEVHENKVKLIRVVSNIGHDFTLICYNQNDKTVIELIQAWQGEFSVKKSLEDETGNFYTNYELVNIFRAMHKSIKSKKGRRYFNKVFLGVALDVNSIEHFDIKNWGVKILNEQPEEYAERIASKRILSTSGS